ncbi:hypothetical protein Ahy_A08g039329 isoform A [Arachis hypogaea]|uniref:Uncharacterized protein n=1 Tax=Arachis hypogaea TaxID=3818 RepID=A0A445BVZ7_ARAHY|nr:hypothetical protein Ahy_A08g039329 isoform A [Arachis hypogaea]
MRIMHRNVVKRSNEGSRIIATATMGVAVGFFIGISLSSLHLTKISLLSNVENSFEVGSSGNVNPEALGSVSLFKIYVPSNPRGAELLPPGIIVSESDLYLRRLWGDPSEDLEKKPKYLVTFTVGYDQRHNINAAVNKVTEMDCAYLLNGISMSGQRMQSMWYAKRFLHPDIVSAFEYIFIWDEDLGVEHFNPDEFINIIKKHGLEISQPGLEPNNGLTWEMTKRRGDSEVHMVTEEKPGWCSDPHLPPCAAFVEIMAPVFSREAWRCVWHMIQNDLVHGWGLDFSLRRCVEPAHEKIGVVDSQWIVHQVIPSLGLQGEADNGQEPWDAVRTRCRNEWAEFQARMNDADKSYIEGLNNYRKG